jgi:threonine/homoserine/homoserine lactone efflux protein
MWLVAAALGFGLGLSLAAPPGPMNAIIAREAARHGAGAGIRVGLGAPVADLLFLALLVFGAAPLIAGAGVVRIAAAAGAGLMFFFAYTTWFPADAAAPRPPDAELRPLDARPRRPNAAPRPVSFAAGFFTALTNPYQIAWWLSGGYVFLAAQGPFGIAGLAIGIFAWVLAFAWLVAHGAQRWPWFAPTVRVASALLLFAFSVLLAAAALGAVAV